MISDFCYKVMVVNRIYNNNIIDCLFLANELHSNYMCREVERDSVTVQKCTKKNNNAE